MFYKINKGNFHPLLQQRAMNLISSLLHLLKCIFNEKMINTPHYLRNANQNYNEISPHNGRNGHHHKKYTKIKSGEGVEKKGTLFPCWWECKLIQPLWKTVWRFLKKLGIKPPYDPAIPLQAYILRKQKLKKIHVSHCSLQHYSQ